MMPRENRTFAVIGLGVFGSTVAAELARFGNHVLGIDQDEKLVAQVAGALSSAIILDTTDDAALREAGLETYDVALIAIGRDIQASILTTMNLKTLGVGTIWVKAMNRTHHRILTKLGADRVILPEQEMGRHIAQMLNNPTLKDYMSLGNGYSVVNVLVPERLKGQPLATLGIGAGHDLSLLAVMRGTERIEAKDDLALEEGDMLVLLGRRPELRQFGESF
jgi:trk system potassium uptake protein TrkA